MQIEYYRYRIQQLKITWAEYAAAKAEMAEGKHAQEKYAGEPMKIIRKKILREIGWGKADGKGMISDLTLIRKSIDARHKDNLKIVYTVDFTTGKKLSHLGRNLSEAPDLSFHVPKTDQTAQTLSKRPVIVGFGPCGMFAALLLARSGYRPIILERGSEVDRRIQKVQQFWEKQKLDPECNVQFGEGGAGTFSDGKLTTGIHDPRVRYVLEVFQKHGADPSILYEQKPHIGTDVLRKVVKNIREEILDLGGSILFDTCLTGIEFEKAGEGNASRITGALVSEKLPNGDTRQRRIPAEILVLAPGHSSRDTFAMLNQKGVALQQKPLSIGVRIEHPQAMIDESQYGRKAAASGLLPPASYKLSYHAKNGRGVYTFCMCPGGEVIPASSEPGCLVVNGMSNRARNSGIANSAVLVDVRTDDYGDPEDPLAGVYFQEKYEKAAFRAAGNTYIPPSASYGEFRDDTEGAGPINSCLPDFAKESIREAMPVFGRRIHGFDQDDAVLKAVETRSSSPVRILRDKQTLESVNSYGIYPGGEGAGYAGGITSSACDGLRIAEKIIEKWKPYGEK
ncbi:MAG: NAD(FAD)-utilizing dehydrogenase [Eubacteriales bacterium]|nr:NAD(FAD)-utilizing dehydrogenase [Eubacteriales bacterium]